MRIALIGSDIPDHCIEFAEAMADSCDVLLCMRQKYYSPDRPQQKRRLEVKWLPWPRQRDLKSILFTLNLSKLIRYWEPDIVHFLYESNAWNWMLPSLLKPTPIITTVHDIKYHPGDLTSSRLPRFFAHALIKQSDAVIVHGERLRDQAARVLPIPPDRIFVAPLISLHTPGRNLESAKQSSNIPLNTRCFQVLFFGRIRAYKGLRFLLESIPLVRAEVPNVRFVIAGEGDISGFAAYLSGLSCVEVRNRFIPRSEVERLFREADLLVLPYIEGSQSGPLTIAMAFGVPVVATDVGDISSVVLSAKMGLVVPPGDKTALAEAITKIALDHNLRLRFSRNAERAMNGAYSKKKISTKVIGIYQSLMDKHARNVA